MKKKLIITINLFIILTMLIPAGGLASVNLGSNEENDLYLPMVLIGSNKTSTIIDGVALEISSDFIPGEFESSAPDDVVQITTAFLLNPFREFSITSASYGESPPTEDLPAASPGGADVYRTALADFRISQGGSPKPSPAVSLFGQTIIGSYSIVDLITDVEIKKPTLIVEWVVEAESKLWIVRIARDLSDGTDPIAFLESLQGLTIEIDHSATQLSSSESTDDGIRSMPIDRSIHSISTLPVPSWWSGNCNVNNHPGSYPLKATFDGLVACGPGDEQRVLFFASDNQGALEWQCVELALRYLYLKYHIFPYSGHGKDIVNNMPSRYIGTLFERISNGTKNKAPASGDVISFGAASEHGHVAVVTSANIDTKGNGTVGIIEQNSSAYGQKNLPVTNWRVGGDISVTNWLHYIYSTPKPGELITIPAGEFQMGCDEGHNSGYLCLPDELPLHTVYLNSFQIENTEVTNAQYAQCVDDGACQLPEDTIYYFDSDYKNHPVVFVNWDMANTYCDWADRRLPTEAEWEKAARGKNDTWAFPWGDQNADCAHANTSFCTQEPLPVGSHPSGISPYGLYDMAGNVWEFVEDWYDSSYYSISPYSNPTGPITGISKVLRGGGWYDTTDEHSRVASRTYTSLSHNNFSIGFRCAADAP